MSEADVLAPVGGCRRPAAAAARSARDEQALPGARRLHRQGRRGARGRRCELLGRQGRGARHRRRVRLRQVDHRAARHRPDRAGRRLDHARRREARRVAVAARPAPPRADGVPGQLRLAQSAPHHRGLDRVRPDHARRLVVRGARARARPAAQGRASIRRPSRTAIRTSSPAASASASTSRARSRSRRGWCCSTRRCRRSTSRSRRRCSTC